MKVTTGFSAVFGPAIANRAKELRRAAAYAHAEMTNDDQSPALPRALSVHRMEQTAPGSSAAGIAATWAPVAGLTGIGGTVWLAAPWNAMKSETGLILRDSERMITLVDIPATASEGEDVLLLSDRVYFDDPVYGDAAVFKVVTVHALDAGITHARVVYAHADEASP